MILQLARQLRSAGLGVELYPEAKKLGQQLKFADRRGFQVVENGGQFVIFCNREPIRRVSGPRIL